MNPAPATTTAPTATRELMPVMRGLLVVFSLLTSLAVGALFVLAETTDRTFAWTIQPPLTAAFLGAGYAAGFVLVVLSLRDRIWAHTRVPVLTVFVFVLLTLAASLLHLDRFHFQAEFAALGLLAEAAAWFWLAVYVVIPLLTGVALAVQERAPGIDPPPRAPVHGALRAALAVQSAVLLVVGVPLFASPTSAATLWPWPLTPLTARVVAAWLIAFGLATALAAYAGDLERLRTAAIAYTIFGVLVLVAVLRFAGTFEWGSPSAWLFLAMAGSVIVTGAAGWRAAPASGRHRGA